MEQIEVGTIEKSQTTEVKVSAKRYQGKLSVDIRLWALDGGKGEMIPTKKGIAVDPSQIPQLIELLQKVEVYGRRFR